MKKKHGLIYIIVFTVSASLLLSIASAPAHALNESPAQAASGDMTAEGLEPSDDLSSTKGNGNKDSADPDSGGTYVNIFDSLYKLVAEYIGEIMCALTLLSSIILTVLYKRGLMPFMTRTAGAIGSNISGIRKYTESYAESSGAEISKISNILTEASSTLTHFSSRLEAMEKTLDQLTSEQRDRAAFKSALECQSTLLYEILMNSSIPQYQKDAVGEKLGALRSAIASLDASEDGK